MVTTAVSSTAWARCSAVISSHRWCSFSPEASSAATGDVRGRAAAVLDLITSSTSGQLDRDTADHHRPRGRPPAYPSAARRGGMSVSDAVLGIRWSGLVVCTRTFRYL